MLIPIKALAQFWKLSPRRIVHVGAHEAEENPAYVTEGWGQVETVWIEAIPDQARRVARKLSQQTNQTVIQAVAWDVSNEIVEFNITNNIQSSSVLARV